MTDPGFEARIDTIRRFNRFYTRQIGLLPEGYLESPFSLTDARVLYELAHHETTTAKDLAGELELDTGYLSRILRRFEQKGFISKTPSPVDGRQNLLSLTDAGWQAFAPLNQRSRDDIGRLIEPLPLSAQTRLVEAMQLIERSLDPANGPSRSYILRPHQPGDMGWVVQRHGAMYATEYGWDVTFEALVARIAADFIDNFDPARERCWIAERDGVNVGSVFVVKHPERDGVAKLRMLLVDPSARGLGIGHRLVDECIRFARETGYHTLTLWTNDVLVAARRIYQAAGFQLVHEAPSHNFGHDLVEQTWDLAL
jgi:DNA-binding MarR family transcriptional regulator/GNAT superfamily N-acetyltransferase